MTVPERFANYVTMEIPAKPENVAFARAAAAMFASQLDFTLDELDEIKVAVSEAVSNTVVHAYPSGDGVVKIEIGLADDGSFVLRIVDFGVGIDDVEQARQAQWTSRPGERMGLGFTFMQEYMDKLEVVSEVDVGTRVVMAKTPAKAAVVQ